MADLRDDDNPSPWIPETILHRLAVMGKSVEELSECTGAIARALIQGIEECEPVTKKPNRKALEDEVADAYAVLQHVVEEFKLDHDAISKRQAYKFKYLKKWFRQLGQP